MPKSRSAEEIVDQHMPPILIHGNMAPSVRAAAICAARDFAAQECAALQAVLTQACVVAGHGNVKVCEDCLKAWRERAQFLEQALEASQDRENGWKIQTQQTEAALTEAQLLLVSQEAQQGLTIHGFQSAKSHQDALQRRVESLKQFVRHEYQCAAFPGVTPWRESDASVCDCGLGAALRGGENISRGAG